MVRKLIGACLVALGIYFALQIESGGLLFLGLLLLTSGFWLFLGSLASFGSRGGSNSWFESGGTDGGYGSDGGDGGD